MSIEFHKLTSYKDADEKLSWLRLQFFKEKAFIDDSYWIKKIFTFLFLFYEINSKNNFSDKSEKEITRELRNWLKINEDFGSTGIAVETEPETEGTAQIGYNDLKFTHSFWNGKYFVIECKIIDGTQNSLNEYVYQERDSDGGLYRFLINKYASFKDFGAMLGYIKRGDINIIINKLKKIVSTLELKSKTGMIYGELLEERLLTQYILDKNYTFQSKHTRLDKESDKLISPVQIFHIFFDFSSNCSRRTDLK